MVPEECFKGTGEIKNDVSVPLGAACSSGVDRYVAGLRSSFHIPVCLQRSDSRTRGLVAVISVVSLS